MWGCEAMGPCVNVIRVLVAAAEGPLCGALGRSSALAERDGLISFGRRNPTGLLRRKLHRYRCIRCGRADCPSAYPCSSRGAGQATWRLLPRVGRSGVLGFSPVVSVWFALPRFRSGSWERHHDRFACLPGVSEGRLSTSAVCRGGRARMRHGSSSWWYAVAAIP